MRILQSLLIISGLGVWAQTESPSPEPKKQNCDRGCFDSYRALLGDLSEAPTWVHSTASHFTTANTLCGVKACAGCPFCNVSQPTTNDLLALATLNQEHRHIASSDNILTCTPCLDYVDTCRQALDPYIDETPSDRAKPCGQMYMDINWPSCNPPGRKPNHMAGLTCELDLCTKGPEQCRMGGQCERRICKDLATRNTTATAPPCKDCFKPWLECIHDTCFPATRDCLGASCLGIDVKDCTARCWGVTPEHCQRGGECEHIEYLNSATPYEMSAEEVRVAGLSRECNQYRAECLKTCKLKVMQAQCIEVCDKKYPNGDKRKEGDKLFNCRDTCKDRTCAMECQDKTCCAGPEPCRQGGEVFRCEGLSDLTCRKRGWLF